MLQFVKDNWFFVAWGLWAFGVLCVQLVRSLMQAEQRRVQAHPEWPINLDNICTCYFEVHSGEQMGPMGEFFPLAFFGPLAAPLIAVGLVVWGLAESVVWIFARVRGQKAVA